MKKGCNILIRSQMLYPIELRMPEFILQGNRLV
jgi:hypothetical protein